LWEVHKFIVKLTKVICHIWLAMFEIVKLKGFLALFWNTYCDEN